MNFDPMAMTDFYKIGHIKQYPEGTQEVYSNMTARSNKHATSFTDDEFIINFGLQYVIKEFLINQWNKNFFQVDREVIHERYVRRIENTLGPQYASAAHVVSLWDLGYLPIRIKALPEGAKVPIGVPLFTIKNTLREFFWLTNFLETALSSFLWKPITSATTAYQYRRLFEHFADMTGGSKEFIDFQGHDFSFRGMSNVLDAAVSGAAHLTSFKGTDTIPAIDFVENYYFGNVLEAMIGVSVPATEHSVMCMGGEYDEFETFKRLITETYPAGIVSIVSDTWDFWKVLTDYLPRLKEIIMARDGKVVIRPDSGDPVEIICGDPMAPKNSPEYKGAIECLWDVFGGTVSDKNFKTLDSHIGLIYGDSITPGRAKTILEILASKGFASDNVVLGIGSYTYQHQTRDTHGFAIKSTSGVVNGERREIFKDPKTDDGLKKSAKGLLRVERSAEGYYYLQDQVNVGQEKGGALKVVFENGVQFRTQTFEQIRDRIQKG